MYVSAECGHIFCCYCFGLFVLHIAGACVHESLDSSNYRLIDRFCFFPFFFFQYNSDAVFAAPFLVLFIFFCFVLFTVICLSS